MLILEYHHVFRDMWNRLPGQKVYAVLHDTEGNALDFSEDFPTLKIFDGDHNRFGIELPEDSVRIGYFVTQMASGTFDLPDSTYGRDYDLEFWTTAYSGTFDRTTDMFLDYEKLPFASGDKGSAVDIEILTAIRTLPDEPAGAKFECLTSISYDSTNGRLAYMCWLEKDGEMQTDAFDCVLTVVDSSGNIIIIEAVNVATGDNPIAGFFSGSVLGVNLVADDTYAGSCVIRDVNLAEHTSGLSPVTWD